MGSLAMNGNNEGGGVMQRTMREIMERAIGEMRESLAQEVDEGEAGHWDPDAWEEVSQFTRQMGRRMMQTWAEVKAEQAKAQGPFVPAAGEGGTCTGGNPWRG